MRTVKKPAERIFEVFNYLFLAACAFVTIFPFINVLAVSLSSGRAIISGEVTWLPVEFNWEAYKNLWNDGQLIKGLQNTVIITVVGTAINIVATIAGAYPLAHKRLMGCNFFRRMIVFTMLFSGGMIPSFILVRSLGIMNTFAALWLPGMISVYNMIIMINFFEALPDSIEEAASIDGANDIYILFRIIVPLSMPVIATLTLFYAVGWWNNYYNAMIYINDTAKQPMTVKLMQMMGNVSDAVLMGEGVTVSSDVVPEGVKSAAIIISAVPILCVYPFLQKYFVKGVMIGSVKG